MVGLLLLAVLVLGVFLLNIHGRLKSMEARLADAVGHMVPREPMPETDAQIEVSVTPKPASIAYASERPAKMAGVSEVITLAPVQNSEPEPQQLAKGLNFEELVGGKLPIWVGGISLVFAGFFLVRYTIDAGLLGPGTRSVLAALFALLLVAGSQWGGHLPRIGDSFSADRRIAQSLSGAGVAILYGTLYMAAEIYGLIGVPLTFTLLIATTMLAFALSLKHGPPTALMGLIGGFAAPWVAGLGPDTVPVLLLYLGVFIASLFGLALWRRWLWLLLLASGGGALWTIGLIVAAESALSLVGLFVLVAGAATLLVGERFAESDHRLAALARYAPMGLALVQLAMLLPRLQFGLVGWGFYAALSAAAIGLAWRDERHVPSVFGALLLSLMPLAAGWDSQTSRGLMIAASVGLGLLFALPAHLRARGPGDGRAHWALLALMAQAVPFAAAFGVAGDEFSDRIWGAVAAMLIVPAAYIAFQWRYAESRIDQIVQIGSVALAAAMAWLALVLWLPENYLASATLVIAAVIAAWATQAKGAAMQRLAAVPLGFGIIGLAAGSWRFFDMLGGTLVGERLMASGLPELLDTAKFTLLPSTFLVAVAALPQFRLGNWSRTAAWAAGSTGLLACLWLAAKQVAQIDSPSQFITTGLAERVVMTQALFLAGWLALRHAESWSGLCHKVGLAAITVALFRLCWFDLGVFNPLYVPQALGPTPIANLGTLHLGLTAFWLWQLSHSPVMAGRFQLSKASQIGSLIMMILTALVSVRQLAQGNLVSGANVAIGENYLYSAVLLALAIGWLTIGIKGGRAILRVAGLALLTLVTLKVFLIDAAALEGVLRILSFLGLGIALIGIGWAYGRVMRAPLNENAAQLAAAP